MGLFLQNTHGLVWNNQLPLYMGIKETINIKTMEESKSCNGVKCRDSSDSPQSRYIS